jgi:Ca2+-binding EF-hand superfamily protein
MKTLTMTAAALAILTGAAMAQAPDGETGARPGPDLDAMFERLDADGDGAISREEFAAAAPMGRIRAMAEETPLDRDAFAAEMAADAATRAARIFERLDADGDGLLSAEELAPRRPERRAAMFDRIDADGDGVITREEAEAAHARWRERAERRPEGRGPRHQRAEGRPGRGPDGGPRGDRVERMFERMDLDGDGVITREEAEQFHRDMRERAGQDGRGPRGHGPDRG